MPIADVFETDFVLSRGWVVSTMERLPPPYGAALRADLAREVLVGTAWADDADVRAEIAAWRALPIHPISEPDRPRAERAAEAEQLEAARERWDALRSRDGGGTLAACGELLEINTDALAILGERRGLPKHEAMAIVARTLDPHWRAAWEASAHGGWLLAVGGSLIDRRVIVGVACACIRDAVTTLVPADDDTGRRALELAQAWSRGRATQDEAAAACAAANQRATRYAGFDTPAACKAMSAIGRLASLCKDEVPTMAPGTTQVGSALDDAAVAMGAAPIDARFRGDPEGALDAAREPSHIDASREARRAEQRRFATIVREAIAWPSFAAAVRPEIDAATQ